ncbi:copper homeostasis protein CutC [Cyclobacterium plantarum]|uniref:PF03932 family protein CutC n=1 Tax=Cyclobacterium plantarum TaxID=2716263 RepID=A0ABX0H3J2_9BACT|nr:copper homeostasis protein CutC [Cyclobacterium plantarum]NHE55990.1 copper homeostasis protein CutC [Cyclobacterium plantarum]
MARKNIVFEAPVYTLEAALNAVQHGVDRLELCADFGEGGTTPSAGLLKEIKRQVDVPVFVMIRCRGGDFLYSDSELEIMRTDIGILSAHGADGFVFGILASSGEVNREACARLIQAAEGKPCTFHRAFDLVPDKKTALETIIGLGFERILTSGGAPTVSAGFDMIKKLNIWAKDRIIILPGGGLKPADLPRLNQYGALEEVHSSCKQFRNSTMDLPDTGLKLSLIKEMEGKVLTVDPQLVRSFRAILDELG